LSKIITIEKKFIKSLLHDDLTSS